MDNVTASSPCHGRPTCRAACLRGSPAARKRLSPSATLAPKTQTITVCGRCPKTVRSKCSEVEPAFHTHRMSCIAGCTPSLASSMPSAKPLAARREQAPTEHSLLSNHAQLPFLPASSSPTLPHSTTPIWSHHRFTDASPALLPQARHPSLSPCAPLQHPQQRHRNIFWGREGAWLPPVIHWRPSLTPRHTKRHLGLEPWPEYSSSGAHQTRSTTGMAAEDHLRVPVFLALSILCPHSPPPTRKRTSSNCRHQPPPTCPLRCNPCPGHSVLDPQQSPVHALSHPQGHGLPHTAVTTVFFAPTSPLFTLSSTQRRAQLS